MAVTELKANNLRRKIDLKTFPFKTTEGLEPLDQFIGQDRAIKAIELALEMEHSGYNVFVTGASGTGRTTIVRNLIQKIANQKSAPDDWIYVYNFAEPDAPQCIELPAGEGKRFKKNMTEMIENLKNEIPAAFTSKQYEKQKSTITSGYNERKRHIISQLNAKAKSMNIQIQNTASGFQANILKNDAPISPEEYDKLSDREKVEIDERMAKVQEKINLTIRELVQLDHEAQQKIKGLNEEIVSFIVKKYIDTLKNNYKNLPKIISYLQNVSMDIVAITNRFLRLPSGESETFQQKFEDSNYLKHFDVNVIVDNANTKGAPVVFEPNPTYNNLFGRIEKQLVMGAQQTDFSMIKCGSLQKANGGYLIADANQLLKNSFVYDALKRAIKMQEIRIEDISDLAGYFSTAGLRPQSIPLNLKVILIGRSRTYYLLQSYDTDFDKIFKIRAAFDYETHSNENHILEYTKFISKVCREENLLPFHRSAVREILYYGHRLVDDQEKLSLQFGSLVGIIREANHYAKKENRSVVRARQVQKALYEYEYRNSMVQEKVMEMIKRDIYQIDVDGEKIGQINGISVSSVGDFTFGRPNRISAKTYIGNDSLVNIERKARLSGKFHDKGMLILSGFFSWKFGEYMPLAFSGSLTFEQSYSTIDGDSASSAELYALLSSLASAPIKQGIAVTGAVNQNGEVQAIGGVNQKIEGFYTVCKEKGLTGEQGVVIPRSNVQNLMLKEEVIKAVRDGEFHIWAIDGIEDGIKILTGEEAGVRLRNGRFPKDSLYCSVERQLRTFAKRTNAFRKSVSEQRKKKQKSENDKNDDQEEEC